MDTFWYKVATNGTLFYANNFKNRHLLKTTFMEFIPLTLNDEGLYLCSILRLHKRQISEAFDPVTKPLFTYINVYNKQRPELSLDVIQDITRIYIQFLVGTLFNVLNTQTAECKPLVQEVQRLRGICWKIAKCTNSTTPMDRFCYSIPSNFWSLLQFNRRIFMERSWKDTSSEIARARW